MSATRSKGGGGAAAPHEGRDGQIGVNPSRGRRGHPPPTTGKRRQAREMALQMLYQWELGGSALPEIFRSFDVHLFGAETASRSTGKDMEAAFGQARGLVEGTVEEVASIDELIASQAQNWRLERMPVVDRNILRLAAFQLLREPDVPAVVVIDEAIELAKKFGTERSSAFVNGLLDGLLKRLRAGEPSMSERR
ncbi:MAG TPA: transcription antitermination factor NusB [Thermoanaerobaculia bacterium]|nr:transcription antitermination factor NusB [Thermoanaerobaculia bacterium]